MLYIIKARTHGKNVKIYVFPLQSDAVSNSHVKVFIFKKPNLSIGSQMELRLHIDTAAIQMLKFRKLSLVKKIVLYRIYSK